MSSFNSRRLGRSVGGVKIMGLKKNGEKILDFKSPQGFSLAPGEKIEVARSIPVYDFSGISINTHFNSQLSCDVIWNNNTSLNGSEVKETVFNLTPTLNGYGRIFETRVSAKHVYLTIENTDAVPLTELKVSIYGNK